MRRHGRPPGSDPGVLVQAARTTPLPPGRGYVWGGAESRAMTAVRRYVRDELGMGQEQVSLVAYWRRAT